MHETILFCEKKTSCSSISFKIPWRYSTVVVKSSHVKLRPIFTSIAMNVTHLFIRKMKQDSLMQ